MTAKGVIFTPGGIRKGAKWCNFVAFVTNFVLLMTLKQLCPRPLLLQFLFLTSCPPPDFFSPSSPVSRFILSISFLLDLSGAAGYDVAFIHPRSAVGVLVELVQAPDDVIAALSKK
jgi:hypothetical protein